MKYSQLLYPLALSLASASIYCGPLQANEPKSFQAGQGKFLLNGEQFHIKAAELHYPRIPKEYWNHRIQMCKALGMNTICLYVFWNVHETEPGKYDFEGQNDLRRFIELCQENDMMVILRPGPYVCAEWEMGGLPWWLLKEDDIELRRGDPRFLQAVEKFERRLADEIKGLTASEGGPILMVQVENEYGSYGEDKGYISKIAGLLKELYPETLLFQCDWSSNFTLNGLPDLLWTMNFGTGADIDSQFEELKRLRPDSPLMCSEYWSGWFDKWGANHETRPADAMIEGLSEMLDKGISFSLYMTHGGTNFGHWAGANSPGFAPDVTSYDYDAPINEQGAPTDKYHRLRKLLQKHSGKDLPPVPATIPTMSIEPFEAYLVNEFSNLWGETIKDTLPRSMERYNQGFGMIQYKTTLGRDIAEGEILSFEPRDYVQVSVSGNQIGKLDRRIGENTLVLPRIQKGDTLTLSVEAMGRINFGTAIYDPKGMVGDVKILNDSTTDVLKDWTVSLMPDDYNYLIGRTSADPNRTYTERRKDHTGVMRYPSGLYKGTLEADRADDTFLDMSAWGKGQVWVNGKPLGRFWEIGPQQTLYLPGVWLKEGENEVLILDIIGPRETTLQALKDPINDTLQSFGETAVSQGTKPDLKGIEPIIALEGPLKKGWNNIQANRIQSGRYAVIEIEGNGISNSALAELYLLDREGRKVNRDNWRGIYWSSADLAHNRGIDKLYDLQESTSWESAESGPQTLVIDLGQDYEIQGAEVLTGQQTGDGLMPINLKIYILKQP